MRAWPARSKPPLSKPRKTNPLWPRKFQKTNLLWSRKLPLSENGQAEPAVASVLTEKEFVDRALAAFTLDPVNRDIAIARSLFLTTELHMHMVGAFEALQKGGIGGLKDVIGGALFGKNRK
jgi:hypothetical protein